MATVTFKGNPVEVAGSFPGVGDTAPGFSLAGTDLKDVSLADYAGKRKVLNIVPSLDTPVCATSTRKFNEEAKGRDDVAVLIISADLPVAQGRFCTGEKLDNVIPLSMMRSRNFAKDYGVLIQDSPLAGITARAVIVIDENDKVVYAQLVPEITEEPDYEGALGAL